VVGAGGGWEGKSWRCQVGVRLLPYLREGSEPCLSASHSPFPFIDLMIQNEGCAGRNAQQTLATSPIPLANTY
jgi:hypothetical protein